MQAIFSFLKHQFQVSFKSPRYLFASLLYLCVKTPEITTCSIVNLYGNCRKADRCKCSLVSVGRSKTVHFATSYGFWEADPASTIEIITFAGIQIYKKIMEHFQIDSVRDHQN